MLPSTMRVLVCTAPQDMRASIDSLAAVVRDSLGEEPQSGSLYVFVGKRPTRVKILWWDRNGYVLLYKRLHRALFVGPEPGGATSVAIDGAGLHQLLSGVAKKEKRRGLLQ